MAGASTDGQRLVLVLSPGPSAADAVEYALREARDAAVEFDSAFVVDVLLVVAPDERPAAEDAEARIRRAVSAFEMGENLRTSLDVLEAESGEPAARTAAVLAHVGDESPPRVVVDSAGEFSVEQLRATFGPTTVELTPTDVPHERRRLLHPGGVRRLVTLFVLTYVFYLGIGGFVGGLDLLTGAVSAAVVALSLSHVALRDEPTLDRTGRRLGRTLVFLPVLLWEIAKANVVIGAVILHPRLPIDPSMGTVDFDTSEGLERMVLANSIALTPGTLTIDVDEETFTVHELTAGAREALVGGPLQRYVAWVFHGSGSGAGESGGEGR